jgi:hypothetical protein
MPKRRAETAASTWSRASIAAIPVLKAIAVARRRPISSSAVPREEFVPIEVQSYAYLNRPIPIGFDKTISQPFMVAVMTDLGLIAEAGADFENHVTLLASSASTASSLTGAQAYRRRA